MLYQQLYRTDAQLGKNALSLKASFRPKVGVICNFTFCSP